MNGRQRVEKALHAKGYKLDFIEYRRPCGYVEMAGPDGGWDVWAYVGDGPEQYEHIFCGLTLKDVLADIESYKPDEWQVVRIPPKEGS